MNLILLKTMVDIIGTIFPSRDEFGSKKKSSLKTSLQVLSALTYSEGLF